MADIRQMNWTWLVALVALGVGCGDCADTQGLSTGDDDAGQSWDIDDGDGTDSGDGDSDDGDGGEADAADGDAGDDPLANCPADSRCTSTCCEDGELCIGDSCVVPGDNCYHSNQCPEDYYCESTLAQCLPDEASECFFIPEDDSFEPVVEVAWEADATSTSIPLPQFNQVMMAPAVVDITNDGVPEIVFSTFEGSAYTAASVLRAIDGRTYEPVFDLTDSERMVSGAASLAIGDIDDDGRNEIIGVGPGGQGLVAIDDHSTDWEVKWRTPNFGMNWDGAYLADLDGNGDVEVVAANRVFDGATGEQLCMNADVGAGAQNSLAADLDGDGDLEVVAARGAFGFERDAQGQVQCPTLFTYEGPQGFPAVADFGTASGTELAEGDRDGLPEIAVVSVSSTQTLSLYNGQTGERLWTRAMPTEGHPHFSTSQCVNKSGGGPPTIADFNGDGVPNIASAGACYYVVYEANGDLLWKEATQDQSSRVTGSSVFDFQGNGRAEVVYGDECFLRVYDGRGDGTGGTDVLFKVANTTGTTRELPVVVDVDGDFHADIVLIGNDYSGVGSSCANRWPDFNELGGSSRGIRVVRDQENRWVSTRQVWNQHAYSVTNVCDGFDDSLCPGVTNRPGAIPSGRPNNWEVSHLNNYRQNVQGEGLFLAPDLVVSDIEAECGLESTSLAVTVANEGSRGVIEGTQVAVFAVIDGVEELVTVLETTQLLAPGAKETLSYEWEDSPFELGDGSTVEVVARANDDGTGQRQYRECNEENNETRQDLSCKCTEDSDCEHLPGHYCGFSGQCQLVEG